MNPNVGGPIQKDRIWFFANFARMVSDRYVAGSYLNSCLDCWDYKPDLTRQALDDELGHDGTRAGHRSGVPVVVLPARIIKVGMQLTF